MAGVRELGLPRSIATLLDQARAFWEGSGLATLQRFEAQSLSLQADARRLGSLGWTIPLWARPNFASEILKSVDENRIDELFVAAYRRNGHRQLGSLVTECTTRQVALPWAMLLQEARYTYVKRKIQVTVPALLAALEGLIAAAGGVLKKDSGVTQVTRALYAESSRFEAVLWASIDAFVAKLFESRPFGSDKPPMINRNWILHGRDAGPWTAADALRLFQAIDTLSLLADDEP